MENQINETEASTEVVVEPKKLGIKETKEVAIFLAKLGVSTAQCIITKKFQVSYFIDDVMYVPTALDGITEVPAEIKDIDSEEGKEIIEAVVVELSAVIPGINSDTAKLFIEAGIKYVEGTIALVGAIKLSNQT